MSAQRVNMSVIKTNGKNGSAKTLKASECSVSVEKAPLQGLGRSAIKRLIRRAGVERIAAPMYDEIRAEMKIFLLDTLKDAATFAQSNQKRSVKPKDIACALKRKGRALYGFGVSQCDVQRQMKKYDDKMEI